MRRDIDIVVVNANPIEIIDVANRRRYRAIGWRGLREKPQHAWSGTLGMDGYVYPEEKAWIRSSRIMPS